MALLHAAVLSVATILPDNRENGLQAALVLCNPTGTYAQASGVQLDTVDAGIQDSRRNGKTVTLVDAMLYQPAFDGATAGLLVGAKTVAVSGSNVTFHVTEGATPNALDVSTEFADATPLPALGCPLGFLVTFTEA